MPPVAGRRRPLLLPVSTRRVREGALVGFEPASMALELDALPPGHMPYGVHNMRHGGEGWEGG